MPLTLSHDCQHATTIVDKTLRIHSLKGDGEVRQMSVENLTGPVKFLQWAGPNQIEPSSPGRDNGNTTIQHVLCGGGNQIFVYNPKDESSTAKIDVGENGTLVHASFTASSNEIIVIPEFNPHLTVFSLKTGEQRVLKTPKFAGPATYAIRPNSGHLALLSKGRLGDVLSVHEVETYETITAINLTTTDTRGLKWSPDGKWIVIWDTASQGTKLVIYTADGQWFKSVEGFKEGEEDQDFGVKTVEWSPDSKVLAIGRHDGTVELVDGTTFTHLAMLGDPITEPIGRDVYVERESDTSDIAEYILGPESPVFPYTYNLSTDERVVATISFSPTGGTVATIDESMPNITWMWSLQEMQPSLSGALVHRASVKQLCWNTEIPELLMTVSGDESTQTVHHWLCGRSPRGARLRHHYRGRPEAAWIKTDREMSGLFWVGNQKEYELGYLAGTGKSTRLYQIAGTDAPHPPLSEDDFPLTR